MNTIIKINTLQILNFLPDFTQTIYQIPNDKLELFLFDNLKNSMMIHINDDDYNNSESGYYTVIKNGLKTLLEYKKIFIKENENETTCYLIFNQNDELRFESSTIEFDNTYCIDTIFEF